MPDTTAAAARPNILVYISHDTGRYISPYGIKTVQTPNAERFAAEGLLFERGFCTSPGCSPARSSLFTGRYPHSNGVFGLTHAPFHWDLHRDEVHAARWFKDLGYDTAGIGIAHETHRKSEMGFDFTLDGPKAARARHAGENLAEFLDSRANLDRPFYAQVGVFETHRPYVDAHNTPDASLGVTVPPYLKATPDTERDFAEMQGMCKTWDTGLGDLMATLEARGLADNTLVVVTTDHGVAMPRAKSNVYDAGIEVMLMMRWPGHIAPGRRSTHLISHVDVLPTVLEAAGATPPANLHGVSFLPVLEDAAVPPPRDRIYAEKTYHAIYDPQRALRTERYKYIRNFEPFSGVDVPMDILKGLSYRDNIEAVTTPPKHASEELYDLEADPLEYTNLALDPAYAEQRISFSRDLAAWMHATCDPLLDGPIVSKVYASNRAAVHTDLTAGKA